MFTVPAAQAATPDPKSVSKQKEDHARQLEERIQVDSQRLKQAHQASIAALHEQAAQEKTLHSLLVDQQVKQQELVLSQQYNQQLMLLTQAAQRQGAELEQQATNLMLDYQQKKVEEDFIASQAGVANQFADMQQKFADELSKSSVYPVPPMQPLLGQGVAPVQPMLPNYAPPVLPGAAPQGFLPYTPPGTASASAGVRVPSFAPRPSSSSFGGLGSSTRVQVPSKPSFGSHAAVVQAVPQLQSFVPGQPHAVATPAVAIAQPVRPTTPAGGGMR